jgi:hypothetical protein
MLSPCTHTFMVFRSRCRHRPVGLMDERSFSLCGQAPRYGTRCHRVHCCHVRRSGSQYIV